MKKRIEELESKIQSAYCSERYVDREINAIKIESPNDLSGSLPREILESKSRSRKDLKDLHGRFVCGARNEEAIRHMAKVSRCVHMKEIIAAVAVAFIVIAGAICVIRALANR